MLYIISQVFVIASYAFLAFTYFNKDRKKILVLSFLAVASNAIAFVFLGALAGFFMSVIAMIRNIVFIYRGKDKIEYIDYIILDVRSKEEYDEGHIDGAVLLPVDNIKDEAGPVIGGKNKTILVYCRSGNRSSLAASRLASLGYTDIRDFGGIVDWPYEIVK